MKTNIKKISTPVFTEQGGKASKVNYTEQLRRTVLTCLLWEKNAYENGVSVVDRIKELIPKVDAGTVRDIIKECAQMGLRHVPLLMISELSKIKGKGPLVRDALVSAIKRPDSMAELLSIYWLDGKRPIANAIKKGLAQVFPTFSEYQLAKYHGIGNSISLRDVMFLVHPTPVSEEQAAIWKSLANNELKGADTWEVALSAGKDKKETFERLLVEKRLGGLALVRNLRNMLEAKVDNNLIREALNSGVKGVWPYQFAVAAQVAPSLEDAIENSMFKALELLPKLEGKTCLLVDVSGSMDTTLSTGQRNSEFSTSRLDVATSLAMLLRELSDNISVATFSTNVKQVPPRRGFGLKEAIIKSQPHGSTQLKSALNYVRPQWIDAERVIIITDEQSSDGIINTWCNSSWIINVANNRNGVGYEKGWRHIHGWSDSVVRYISEMEKFKG